MGTSVSLTAVKAVPVNGGSSWGVSVGIKAVSVAFCARVSIVDLSLRRDRLPNITIKASSNKVIFLNLVMI
jgi:hypothetical protein